MRGTGDSLHAGWRLAGVAAVVDAVIASLVSSRGLTSATLVNRVARMRLFAAFLQAEGVPSLEAASPAHVRNFVDSRRASGATPTLSERHSRRAAVRLLYREARRLGLSSADPAVDLELPPRNPVSARPLIDQEIEVGRSYAVRSFDTRPAVCWALAEATARTSEMPHLRVSDLDIGAGTIWIHGGATTDPRLGRLTRWGSAQLHRRLQAVERTDGPTPILMGEGEWDHPDEGRAAATMALVGVLKAARLSGPGVNPRSIAFWAAAKAHAEGACIDAVARMLGVRRLDDAARAVGFNWRREETR
jgi:hypothetical protein